MTFTCSISLAGTKDRRTGTHTHLLVVTTDSVMHKTDADRDTGTYSDTLWEANKTRQWSVTHINSETKTNTSRRWLNAYCFGGNSNTLLTSTVRLPLIDALTEAALSFSACPIVAVLFYGVAPPPLLIFWSLCLPALPPSFFASFSSCHGVTTSAKPYTAAIFFLPHAGTLSAAQWLLEWHEISFSLLIRQQVIEFLRCQTDLIRRSSSFCVIVFIVFCFFFILAVLKYHPR